MDHNTLALRSSSTSITSPSVDCRFEQREVIVGPVENRENRARAGKAVGLGQICGGEGTPGICGPCQPCLSERQSCTFELGVGLHPGLWFTDHSQFPRLSLVTHLPRVHLSAASRCHGCSWSCLLFWLAEIIRMKISIAMPPDALLIKRGERSTLL